MGAPTRMLALAAGALMLGALVGCTSGAPKPTRTPTASQTPLFASDEAALKAATDAYAAYLKMSDTIAHDGGKDPDRIKPYVTAAWAKKEIAAFDKFAGRGLHQVGNSKFDHVSLQAYQNGAVSIYVCSDVSMTRILDSNGKDVVPTNRRERFPLTATFVGASASQGNTLALEKYEPWSGQDFC